MHTRAKGNLVEDLAAQYLQSCGLVILTRNFYCAIGEIDIICQDNRSLTKPSAGVCKLNIDMPEAHSYAHSSTYNGNIDMLYSNTLKYASDLVFVEVRYRKTLDFGSPIDSINYRKQQKLIRVAQAYLTTHKLELGANCRFDIIGVNGNLNAPEIEWLQNAFLIW